MGVLGQPRDAGAAAVAPPMQGPVERTGFFSNVGAGFRQAVAGPHSTRVGEAIYEQKLYDDVVKALAAEGEQGEDLLTITKTPTPVKRPFRNPYVSGPSENLLNPTYNPLTSLYGGGDRREIGQIWAAVERVRRRKPDFLKAFPNEGALAAFAMKRRQQQLAVAQAVTERAGTAGTVGGFVGAMGGSIASMDPENAVGGFGTAAGKTFARTVIKRAAEGAGVNAAASVAALPGVAADAQRLGQELTPDDMKRQVGVSAAIGAVFGVTAPFLVEGVQKGVAVAAQPLVRAGKDAIANASVRAGTIPDRLLIDEWHKAHSPGGTLDTSTPDERAAAHTIIRDVENREASPLQPDAAAHNEARLGAIARSLGVNLAAEMPSPAPIQHPTIAERNQNEPRGPQVGDHIQWEVNGQLQFEESAAVSFVSDDGQFVMVEGSKTGIPVDQVTIKKRGSRARPQARNRVAAQYDEALHHAEGTTKNPDSSADGHFQFTEGTWLEYAPRVADTKGKSRAQVLALRHDRGTAEKAERLFRADNARYLRERGVEDNAGNLSLAHFLGRFDAAKVLQAAPDKPIGQLVDASSIRANRTVFKNIRTASDMVAWAHKRIGAAVDRPAARADAVPDADGLDAADYSGLPYERATFTPEEVETDAALMQYKSGGDESGVTGKLRDVTAWNPLMSSEILVWEGADGRRVVVDGHQRLGLARKLAAAGEGIDLPALVVREADGITAAQARVLGALRNINLGTGSLLDNARVLRDLPDGAGMIRGAENRREIEGLSRLSYEAFGATLNDVVDPRIAAEIGKNAPDPATHMAMVDLLRRERIHNPAEAAAVVRQAQADGFGLPEEQQLSLLGSQPQQSLYVPIARILSAAQKRLREEKRTFRVLSEKAGRIEEAGNVLDREANEGKVVGSDEALTILDRTAHRAGPVRDALIAAARAELSGARRADAVNRFLDDLAGIDLRAAARGADADYRPGEPSGEAGGRDAAAETDRLLAEGNGPGLFDHAVAAREAAEPFSDPIGEGAKAQAEIIEHDLLMEVAAPQASPLPIDFEVFATQLGASRLDYGDAGAHSPGGGQTKQTWTRKIRSIAVQNADLAERREAARREYDAAVDRGEIRPLTDEERLKHRAGGEGQAAEAARRVLEKRAARAAGQPPSLFDLPETGHRLSEEGGAKPFGEIMREAEDDELAAKALRDCLKGGGGEPA